MISANIKSDDFNDSGFIQPENIIQEYQINIYAMRMHIKRLSQKVTELEIDVNNFQPIFYIILFCC
jgi:hypothetical protein